MLAGMMNFADLETPIGRLRLVSDGAALQELHLRPGPRTSLLNRGWREDGETAPLPDAIRQLQEYFAGRRREFNLPLALEGSPFQRQVWEELLRIPFGSTLSYGDVATRIGSPGASRAVGLANNRNPVAIIVPCHRVIGADGSLGGFGGGVPMKRWLLRHEGAPVGAQQSLL